MEEKKKVMVDAGHGGTKDPGAVFEDRMEKDDTLRLALAVGRILEENGVNAVYTRSTDVYDTPYQKAEMGNEAGADQICMVIKRLYLEGFCGFHIFQQC